MDMCVRGVCMDVLVHGFRREYVCMSVYVHGGGRVCVHEHVCVCMGVCGGCGGHCGEKSEEESAFCGGFLRLSSELTKQPGCVSS